MDRRLLPSTRAATTWERLRSDSLLLTPVRGDWYSLTGKGLVVSSCNVDTLPDLPKITEAALALTKRLFHNTAAVLALSAALLCVLVIPAHWTPPSVQQHKWVALPALVFCLAYQAGAWFSAGAVNRRKREFLEAIGRDERGILKLYLEEDRSCRMLGTLNGAALSLVAKGLIHFAAGVASPGVSPFMVDPRVMDWIRKNPDLLRVGWGFCGSKELSEDEPQSWNHVGHDHGG